jgi:hypothetical protein
MKKVRAILVGMNWCLSLLGLLSGCAETAFPWVFGLALGYFGLSTLLLKYADKKGWMDCLTFLEVN